MIVIYKVARRISMLQINPTRRLLSFGAACLALLLAALTISQPGTAAAMTQDPIDLGPNVLVFDPTMPQADIQAQLDAIATQMVPNQFGSERYALLFKPGTYGTAANPLWFQVGYYTEVAGLGAAPADVVINGHIDVYNQCLTNPDGSPNCIALINFWRSLSNLTLNVTAKPGGDGCRNSGNFWAVSQAAPMRRVNITGGNLTLMDYCTAGPQYASGGFMADTQVNAGGTGIINGSQQQWMTRDSSVGWWSNAVWNQVFSGVLGAPATSFGTGSSLYDPPAYTTLATTPVIREKPFLTIDENGEYAVFVPSLRYDTAGTTWASGPSAGSSIPLSDFFVARPGDRVEKINAALARGKHLLLTPGVYHLDRTIDVKRPDTVVLGLGFATLIPDNGITALTVADVPGVKIASVLIDAGPVNSPVLMEVGKPNAHNRDSADNPISLHDVFFRVGGAGPGKATVSLIVNSDNTILDHLWVWRADHGEGVGWDVNTADNGVIVNGDHVTAYALMVEHYQKYNVIWNGEYGRVIMFQNEMPYDAPNQAAWMNGDEPGYAAYKVADTVQYHEAWGLGSYCVFTEDASIHSARGFEVPDVPGVVLHSILTISLGGVGTIDHVVNHTGLAAEPGHVESYLISYP
jgi:hypothetical protein